MTAVEFMGIELGSMRACEATEANDVVTPQVAVGRYGPLRSRGIGREPNRRARQVPRAMCASNRRDLPIVPPSKRAPHARGHGRMPSANNRDAFAGVGVSYRSVLWLSSVDVRRWWRRSLRLLNVSEQIGHANDVVAKEGGLRRWIDMINP